MPLPITMYGATYCDDTHRTRAFFQHASVPFEDINIDHDEEAEEHHANSAAEFPPLSLEASAMINCERLTLMSRWLCISLRSC